MARPTSLEDAVRSRYARPANTGQPTRRVAAGLETVNGANARLRQLLNEHEEARRAIWADVQADRNLTPEGKRAAVRERNAQLAERTAAALDELRAEVNAATETITVRAAAHLPKPATGVEALLGRQAHWARARSLLESGVDPKALIAETTDAEVLHALRDEAPVWVRTRGGSTAVADQVRHRVDLQLARVTSDDAAADMVAAHQAAGAFSAFEVMADQATSTITGQGRALGPLDAAVNARIVQQDSDGYWAAIETGEDIPDDAA